ncbi:putative disease resistance protein At4g19050 isoform X10 [Carya illinoinensis]|nr:putative disease resistance protein At4g19050 isoform X10 [Carya illinoinensis]
MADQQSAERSNETKSKEIATKDSGHPTESAEGNKEVASTKEIARKDSGNPTESAEGNKEVASTKEIARKDSGNPTESAEGNKEVASTKEISRKDSINPRELAKGNKEVASTKEIARKDSGNPTESAEGNKEVASTKEIARKDSGNPTELAEGNKEVTSTKEIARKDSGNPTELAEGNKEVASTKGHQLLPREFVTELAEGNKEVASTKEIARKDSGNPTESTEGNKEVASTKEIARKNSGNPIESADGNKEVASTKEIASQNPTESAARNKDDVKSTEENDFENYIMEQLEDENVETIALEGEAGVGKTWKARKSNDFIINSENHFYGNLWISMNKEHDKRFLYDVLAHQLSVQASTDDYQEGNDEKKSEELVRKITNMLVERKSKESEVLEITKMLREMELKKMEELVSEIPKKLRGIESNNLEVLVITKMVREMESKKTEELKRKITQKLGEMEEKKLWEMAKKKKSGGSDRLSDNKVFQSNDRLEDQKPKTEKSIKSVWKKKEKNKTVGLPINEKSGGHISSSKEKLFLLVILDDIRSDSTYEEGTRAELETLLPKESRPKFLVTRRRDTVSKDEKILKNGELIIDIEPLREKESGTLFKKLLKTSILHEESFVASIEKIAQKSNGLPIAVVKLVVEALNLSGANDLELLKLENALKQIANYKEADKCTSSLLRLAIHMLHGSDHGSCSTPGNDTLVNCYWHSWEFISRHGAIDYNVLIFSWILEGYFGSADHIKQSYEEGHRVLMKLIGCGLLKMLEDNLIMMEELVLSIPDCRRDGYEQRSVLGLARVLDESIWKGFGTLAPSDYMIKTPKRGPKKDKYISTLLIHGSSLCREDLDLYFEEKLGLQNLAIFNPRFDSIPRLLSKMEELCVLILRGCDQLQEIDAIQNLKSLTVLEISDANFLEKKEKITGDLFKEMTNLQTLNLCAVSIKMLPSSLSNLKQLRWLILRRCPFLESLPNLKELTNLEVLDLSGSTSLLNITDKTFSHLKKIQFLDFSHTSIKRLPFLCNLGNLENLTQLLLRNCKLNRLPSFKALPALQCIDISASNSNMLKDIKEDFFENKDKLKILHLSKTEISRLPSNFGNFPNLELLDLSDSSKLVTIPENAFKNMGCLRHLNLSNTKLESLPKISNLVNLRQLFLENCALHKLPKMEGVTRLEELHLSNASSLVEIEDQSFDYLSHIYLLDFSHTKIKTLPSLAKLNNLRSLNLSGTRLTFPCISSLTNLTQLSLRGCSISDQSEPNFGEHKKLEVLDLSEITGITSLSTLNNLTSLRELKLRGCSKLEQLQHLESLAHLEVLDLWETGIKQFPKEICKLTQLKHLDLPKGIMGIQESDLQKMEPEFHFYVFPEQGKAGDIHWHKVDPNFRRIYFNTLSLPGECRQFLEIIGSIEVKDVLKKAAYISLIGNKFITRLSDLGVENVDAMKGCWLQRCPEMETLCLEEEIEDKTVGNLEILWVSNLPKLKDLCSGIQPAGGGFKNLTEMYLDCCPLIKSVFHSSQFPEKLKILQIKFCEDLEILFEPNTLDKAGNLEILRASNLPKLKDLCSGIHTAGGGFKNLTEMYLDCCPLIKYVFHSSQFPEKLKILRIKFCKDLKRLFEQNNVLDADKKWSLQKLHLVELPKLTEMGVPESKKIRDVFPSLEAITVKECPMLEIMSEKIKEANCNNVEEDWNIQL